MRAIKGLVSQKFIINIFIILGVLIFGRLSFFYSGHLLVAQDDPQRSDIIVVLMGSGPDRMLGAVDLYQAGYADKILLVRNMIRGYDLVSSKGVKIPHDSEIQKMVAVQLGVPEEKVVIVPGNALITQDEAVAIRKYLRKHKSINSLIVVTSLYHSGRSKKIFIRAMSSMERPIKIISCPSKYDDFNKNHWWQSREDLKRGIQEYMKLTNFYFHDQFEL